MSEAKKDRMYVPPTAPDFQPASGRRTLEETQYIYDVAAGIIRLLYTLPYGEYVEVPNFPVNMSRFPKNGSYNNRGGARTSEGNYGSFNDLTFLRDKIRKPWKNKHPDETLHISWPEEDEGRRLAIPNPDNRTFKFRVIRCSRKNCRIRRHRGVL